LRNFPGLLDMEAPERLEALNEANRRLQLCIRKIKDEGAHKAAYALISAVDMLLFGSEEEGD